MILMKNYFNQNHGIKLMRMFILINEFEIHAFFCPFHSPKCHFFRVFDIKLMKVMNFFSFFKSLGGMYFIKIFPYIKIEESTRMELVDFTTLKSTSCL
jgi:hypothetical protein